MPAQLLPFQKLVDMPATENRRRAICGLAIASIVLVSIIMGLFAFTLTITPFWGRYTSFAILTTVGIPSMVILLVLVCTSSGISLRNTDKWVSTDACCNLMRSHPTCCTKSCGGNKCCCARLSSLHIAASVCASLCFFVIVAALSTACNATIDHHSEYHDYYTTTTRSSGDTDDDLSACKYTALFLIPMFMQMICLAIITAISAWLLRQIEQGQPEIEVLPAGKMVVQACPDNARVVDVHPVDDAQLKLVMGNETGNGAETAKLVNGTTNGPNIDV